MCQDRDELVFALVRLGQLLIDLLEVLLGALFFGNRSGQLLGLARQFVGSLLLLSLVFTNLWGYEPIEAGFALVPVPLSTSKM